MSDPMSEILASFFIECEELHETLTDALQTMADGEHDVETINVAFRAVHSIKGGAGAFGLDDLVAFAHQFETVMDACRSGTLTVTNEISDLLLRCGDMLSDLVRCCRDDEEQDADAAGKLIAELAALVDTPAEMDGPDTIDFQPTALDLQEFDEVAASEPSGGPAISPSTSSQPSMDGANRTNRLTIRFRPEPELYESGNEPLYLLRSLADLGDCTTTVAFAPPKRIGDLAEGGNRLTWTVAIDTDAKPEEASEIFEFVAGLCELEVDAGDTTVAPDLADISDPSPSQKAVPPASGSAVDDTPVPLGGPRSNPAPRNRTSQHLPKASPTVRVDLERIERLVNLVGELVINQAMLAQSIDEENIPPNSPVSSGLDEFMQLTRSIQESVMMIRAQPVKSLFQRMSRIVREASATVDKTVRLVTEGEATEIDKTAIEGLAEPLTHMIRNAVDHGLEPSDERAANGKPEQGVIRLAAQHRSGRVVIELSDDGRGINRKKVLDAAVAKGLVPDNASLAEGEIDQLLFVPGFSTAAEVSALSGRGVGMDVVKTQITSLGGRITIDSTPGVGTKFTISLPLTLAVLDGMVVTVAGETLVVPLNAIVETLSLTPGDLNQIGPNQAVLRVRDKIVPVIDLGKELGYRSASSLAKRAIALLISPEEGRLFAMLVDTIEDQRQVVIKGLQDSYGRVRGVAAATILGDGKIALILDTSDITIGAATVPLEPLQKEAS